MKFSCPSCHAKYQLADEKVAGRTVKMKCRKCGSVIAVNETGVVEGAHDGAPLVSLPPPAPTTAEQPAVVPRAGAAPRPAAPRPAAASAALPRPAAPSANLPRPAAVASPQRASASLAKPSADVKIAATTPTPSPVGAAATAAVLTQEDDPAGPPSMRRLASRAPVAAAEWFAGIDGNPVGPLTREELRKKIDAKAAHGDTLVWREGMTGWVALGQVPDVSDLLVPEPRLLAPPAPSPSVETASGATGSRPLDTALGFERSAALEEEFFSNRAKPAAVIPRKPEVSPLVQESPAVHTATIQLPEPEVPSTHYGDSSHGPRPSVWARARSHITKTQIAFAVFCALACGLAMGFLLFGGKGETKVVKEIVHVQVPVNAPPPPSLDELNANTQSAESGATATNDAKKSGSVGAASTAKPAGTVDAVAPKGGLALSDLGGGVGPSGPSGSSSGPGSASGGAALEASQIQSTVTRYQSAVKRGCWEPALSSRDADAPSSARVTVSVTVGPTGKVSTASGSGDPKGYRGLSSCIEQRVRTWQFPTSSGTTNAKIPFVFAAQ